MSFTAICIELWRRCIWRGGGAGERKSSVSKACSTFGNLSRSLWKHKVRQQLNLPSWDQDLPAPPEGVRERRWDFPGRWPGKSWSEQTKCGFFSESTGITVFLNTLNKAAGLLLSFRFFHDSACVQWCQIFLWSHTAISVFTCNIAIVLNHSY